MSKKIIELNNKANHGKNIVKWMSYGETHVKCREVSNLFRLLGVKSINGVHSYPQKKLWGTLDPDMRHKKVWNRYCHLSFVFLSDKNKLLIESLEKAGDVVIVKLNPDHFQFSCLDVNYILFSGSESCLKNVDNVVKIFSYAGRHIYKVMKTDKNLH